jgi:dihydroxyacetone kinase-like protein
MNTLRKGSQRLNPEYHVRMSGETLRQWMKLFAARIDDAKDVLTELDAAIGDGDHGVNMNRGMSAVMDRLNALSFGDLSGQMRVVSTTLMSSVGGASGPLYGAFFLQSSHAIQHKTEIGLADLTSAVEAGGRGVVQLGKAAVGDKTMVDTLAAAAASSRASCNHFESFTQAVTACRKAARVAAEGTTPMVARKGRASYLGERSAGTQDPGATSVSLLFDSLAEAITTLSPHLQVNIPNPILL